MTDSAGVRPNELNTVVRRLAFLARAGELLASSLDYDRTLDHLARLAVPAVGDFCIVDVLDGGDFRRVAAVHALPAKTALLDELRRRYPATPDSPQPAARVLRSGEPELLAVITPELVDGHTIDREHAAIIRALGIRSHVAVPLVARGSTIGVLSIGVTESDRRYGERDVAFAQDLGRLAALAVDNARLYQVTQNELGERRRAEAALRLSEERFRAVMEQSPLSTQIFDGDGATLRVNRAWEELWGIAGEAILGYNVRQDPQLAERGVRPYIERAFDGEPTDVPAIRYDPNETVPDRSQHPDPVRWVSAVAYPVKDDTGRVREVVLVHEDVTQVKAAEESMRLLADAGDALGASLDEQDILRGLTGLLVPRFADLCAIDLLDDAGALQRVALSHADAGQAARFADLSARYPARRSDPFGPWAALDAGAPQWARHITPAMLVQNAYDQAHLRLMEALQLRSFICIPLVTRGNSIGVLTLLYGGSGRQYSAADVELAHDLGRRAATAVDNARLYQQLRAEHRRKDEFLATLAHELRNPLAPIRTGLALLRVPRAAEATDKTLQIMERQLGHMVRLIDDLLDLSRVTRGTVQLERERVDLWSIVGMALEASRPLLDAAGLQLTVRLPEQPVVLEADRTRLAQVLSNLLNNAAKFTGAGGRVELQAAVESTSVLIRVTDTGLGIPADMLTQIFDMFTQVGGSGTRGQGGLGIGLTLVRRLVELHGGQVWAQSPGRRQGSTFVVRLPLPAAPPAVAHATGESRAAAASGAARRILVVDDNIDAADTLSALLATEGHDVRTAASGAAALPLARAFVPEIAFLDIGMPDMSGYELARQLRSDPALAKALLVAVTGWGQADDRRQSRDAGFDHHLTKPVAATDVLNLVAQINRAAAG